MALSAWQATIVNESGDVIPSAQIQVIDDATGLNADIFANSGGTPAANPFTATAGGFAQFYANAGTYRVIASDSGTGFSETWEDQRLGDAQARDTGTGATDVPTNADLGTAAYLDTGTASGEVPTNGDLGTAATKDVANLAQALAGDAGVLPDAAGVHAAFKQYGLGSSASPNPGFDFNTDFDFSGFISPTLGGNASNSPYSSWGGLISYKNEANAQAGQLYLSNITSAGATEPRLHIRTRPASGAWTPWVEMYHTGNSVGTVSQSGGVPTGAIIERGSNANGEYVKYADGTLICWKQSTVQYVAINNRGSIFHTDAFSFTYPVAFSSVPHIINTVKDSTGLPWAAREESASVSGFTSRFAAPGNTDAGYPGYIAIGRWF